ncbi:outer-membrane receptor for ferric coprogen and ferric-rhodotorulic acid [Sphingomonas laterariae]|uniref:Outer-membrane receptor for ferric coprogen and ferric-rhodotorulic acid n=1 Tax=Edaphosphingomonas laterariae TaxID=861865 RepID=A0A239DSU9_9SPHN|nr:TonB-dependent siderophore receptor [Sphingomonas laterariae]SNS35279.1 outer-membrane receptor for ferric coprogen and ferric-rhodotorulic acid [Sphingomonas laterariae]
MIATSLAFPSLTRRGASAIALACGLAVAAPALAQSAEKDRDAADRDAIVVTGYTTSEKLGSATGLGLSILETPQSVTVMTADRMDDQAIRTLSDVMNNAAGVSVKALDSSRNGFSARGFDIDIYQVDGIPVQWVQGFSAGESNLDVAIYQQVEIVRGATGLLTGVGNPSASVNLIRKHADSDELTASITASASRWDNYQIMGDVSTPITADGAVRARVVAKYEEGDSFIDILHNKKLVLYGVIDADITPGTHLSVGASYQDHDASGTQWGGLPTWYADGSRTDWRRSKTIGANWTTWPAENYTYFADLTQQLGDKWNARLYGNYTNNKSDMRLLYLYGYPDKVTGLGMGASPARYDARREQMDVGIRVNGSYGLFGREHELMVGASYAKQDFSFFGYASSNVAAVGDFLNWDGSFPEPTWGARSQQVDLKTKQWGYFASTRLHLADGLKAILGGRLNSWDRNGLYYGTSVDYGYDDKFTPYAGLLYEFAQHHTAYVSYTDIYQPQERRDRTGKFLDPLSGSTYEAGLKSSFFGGRLITALSVFRIQQDNFGIEDGNETVPGTGGNGNLPEQAYIGVKGIKSTGFEVEANGEVLPGWSVSGNYTQFKAKDRDGNRVNTLFPQKLLRLFTTYKFGGSLDGLVLGGGVNWEGLSYTDTFNPVSGDPERLEVKSYAVVNLMGRYQFAEGLSAQLNVENLFNKKYYSQIGFYDQHAFGEPRNVTLTLKYQF